MLFSKLESGRITFGHDNTITYTFHSENVYVADIVTDNRVLVEHVSYSNKEKFTLLEMVKDLELELAKKNTTYKTDAGESVDVDYYVDVPADIEDLNKDLYFAVRLYSEKDVDLTRDDLDSLSRIIRDKKIELSTMVADLKRRLLHLSNAA